ncbi:phosphate/phosphite/phosphonate ABC transporter substrate-binding protein [Halanaerobium congolense]|uniref:ABC-type phosphate/phosphonate transport system substrate-binding protein n=1 Tax=Halanaerobium congolense TaxID=54121 RepID=A0A1G6R0E1_9FIRM|nr:PhnD/SsuA/transferrin family substrate-binding protein [Halanaerobium congolense]PXV64170.1 ABC-type phosphate/phosphonate transport system substrate-binding protein [Halanaerobium congolense]SDC97376.1 ABC-type phosphate/phosphonate transport system, substrate-binding protein [Halanaerobium congolense]
MKKNKDLNKNFESKKQSSNELLNLSQEISFKSQDLIWLLNDNNKKAENLVMRFENITESVENSAAGAEEISATIEELSSSSNVIKSEMNKLEELSQKLMSDSEKNQNWIEESNNTLLEVATNVKKSGKSIESFNMMNNNLHNVIDSISKLSSSTDNQASATEQTIKAVESMTQEFINISENVSEVDKNIKNQKKNSETLINYSNNLNAIAYDFHKISVDNKSEDMLIFGVNPFTKPEKIEELYVPIIEKLCKKINKNAKTVIVSDYKELTNYIKNGLIDIGWFSPMAYVEAKDETNVIPMVTPLINGQDSYRGYIFTKKNSKYRKLTELKEKLFLGNHDNVIKAVLNNEVEVGATYNEAWERAASTLNLDSLNILAKTDLIPKDVIAARSGLDQNLLEETRNIFLNADQEIKEVLNQTNITGFTESEDQKFDIIRKYNN